MGSQIELRRKDFNQAFKMLISFPIFIFCSLLHVTSSLIVHLSNQSERCMLHAQRRTSIFNMYLTAALPVFCSDIQYEQYEGLTALNAARLFSASSFWRISSWSLEEMRDNDTTKKVSKVSDV